MADYSSIQIDNGTYTPVWALADSVCNSSQTISFQVSPTNYYRMRARVTVCVSQPSYHYWTATTTPDTTGAQVAPGTAPCGANPLTDFVDFTVVESWSE